MTCICAGLRALQSDRYINTADSADPFQRQSTSRKSKKLQSRDAEDVFLVTQVCCLGPNS